MKFMHLIAFGVLFAATTPCPRAAASEPAASLQHLFTDKDCESVPELLGDWQAEDDLSGTWTLQKLGEHNYRLIQQRAESDTSNKSAFDLCVARLDGYLFFDATFQEVMPDGKKAALGEDDNLFWIPLHLIGRLDVEDDALHFRLLSDDWLQDALKSGRVQLTCSKDDEGNYLLTAPSKELKQFAARFATDPKAFSYREEFEGIHSEAAKRWSSRPVLLTDPRRRVATNYSHSDPKEFSKETQVAYRARRLPGSRGFASNHRLRLEYNVPTPLGCNDASHASDQFLRISDSFVQPVPQRKVINASQTLP